MITFECNLSKVILAIIIMMLFGPLPSIASNCKIIGMLENHEEEKIDAICSKFLSQANSTGISCYWEFSFRDVQATQRAKAFWEKIKACREGNELEPDLKVNHPDSYELKEWVTQNGFFRVSVKDKTQLGKTLVFLRFEITH